MAYAPEPTLTPRKLVAIVVVVLLHVGLFAALKAGLARQAIELITGPLDVKIIEEEIVPDKEPPPPPVKIETPPPFVPPPEIAIDLPPPPPEAVFQVSPIKSPPGPPPVPTVTAPPPTKITNPGTGGRVLSEPEYPPVSRRLGQEGTVTLNLYILQDGRVGDGKVLESSGFPKLDEAALNHAKRAWRFVPARENGKPIAMWFPYKVTFQLTDKG